MKKEVKMNGNLFTKFQGIPQKKTLAEKENDKWITELDKGHCGKNSCLIPDEIKNFKTPIVRKSEKIEKILNQISAESKKKTEIEMLCMSDAKEFAQYILSNCSIDKYKSFVCESVKGYNKGTPITIYDLYYSYLDAKS